MPLTYTVRFWQDAGLTLRPHRHRNGKYKALKDKFGPSRLVDSEGELIPYLKLGWMIRMSAPGHPPSGICPESVQGWK